MRASADQWLEAHPEIYGDDAIRVYNKIVAGTADGIIYSDFNKIYAAKYPTLDFVPVVPATRPTVLGFQDWITTNHPEGLSNNPSSAMDQVSLSPKLAHEAHTDESSPRGNRNIFRTSREPASPATNWPCSKRPSKAINPR
jgi:hypothetical protein